MAQVRGQIVVVEGLDQIVGEPADVLPRLVAAEETNHGAYGRADELVEDVLLLVREIEAERILALLFLEFAQRPDDPLLLFRIEGTDRVLRQTQPVEHGLEPAASHGDDQEHDQDDDDDGDDGHAITLPGAAATQARCPP